MAKKKDKKKAEKKEKKREREFFRKCQSALVEITKAEPSIEEVSLRTKHKEWVRWIGTDAGYELWFKTADYPFSQTPDIEQRGYKIIRVKLGKATRKYTLSYDLPAGEKKEHPYDIRLALARDIPGPPEGPSVWGEG